MATEVDICNLALAHLGDDATISSLSPPEGSAQAQHCARFYPIARDGLLEMHDWNFNTRRESLALLAEDLTPWTYRYAVPSAAVRVLSVLPAEALSDTSQDGQYTRRPFKQEVLADGTKIILTNEQNAVALYTFSATDTTQFSPLFVTTLSFLLASYVAGPMIKGADGMQVAGEMRKQALYFMAKATGSDANQQNTGTEHNVPWMVGR